MPTKLPIFLLLRNQARIPPSTTSVRASVSVSARLVTLSRHRATSGGLYGTIAPTLSRPVQEVSERGGQATARPARSYHLTETVTGKRAISNTSRRSSAVLLLNVPVHCKVCSTSCRPQSSDTAICWVGTAAPSSNAVCSFHGCCTELPRGCFAILSQRLLACGSVMCLFSCGPPPHAQ